MSNRKPISNKLRFEVFKRDKFQCQYCGKSSPEVILECDHISPVSKGGGNDIMNLVTSCRECNSGKSDRTLDDDSVVVRQRQQLAELEERRQQLEEMLKWRDGLSSLNENIIDALSAQWANVAIGFSLNESGIRSLKKLIGRFTFQEISEAIDTAATQYIQYDANNDPTHESIETAWHKIPGIINNRRNGNKMRPIFYARGIIRRRFRYVNEKHCIPMLQTLLSACNGDEEVMFDVCKKLNTWTEFRELVDEIARPYPKGGPDE